MRCSGAAVTAPAFCLRLFPATQGPRRSLSLGSLATCRSRLLMPTINDNTMKMPLNHRIIFTLLSCLAVALPACTKPPVLKSEIEAEAAKYFSINLVRDGKNIDILFTMSTPPPADTWLQFVFVDEKGRIVGNSGVDAATFSKIAKPDTQPDKLRYTIYGSHTDAKGNGNEIAVVTVSATANPLRGMLR